MEQRQRLFIYDRREMGILLLLGLMIALFAFTLGVHLGKHVGIKVVTAPIPGTAPVAMVPDVVPPPEELADQARGAEKSVGGALTEALKKEVDKTGVHLDVPRPVDFPSETRAERSALKLPSEEAKGSTHAVLRPIPGDTQHAPPAEELPVPTAKFTLQVGSHAELEEAKTQLDQIEQAGLKPYLRAVDLGDRGKWFRVYVGGYASRDEAMHVGIQYRKQKLFRSFLIASVGQVAKEAKAVPSEPGAVTEPATEEQ